MPGVGKSTLGVLLAKLLACDFVDTDVFIQARERRALQEIINTEGRDAFRALEERGILTLRCRNTIIATGGSAVYGARAMAHLRSLGVIVHLHLPLPLLRTRLRNFESRGVLRARGQSLESLFAERDPLYRDYADVTVDCSRLTHEAAVQRIIKAVGGRQ